MLGLTFLFELPLLMAVFDLPQVVTATAIMTPRFQQGTIRDYSRAHSLGSDYQFSARDGWTTLNVSDLPYKYSRATFDSYTKDIYNLGRRTSRKDRKNRTKKPKAKPNKKGAALTAAGGAGALAGLGEIGGTIGNVGDVLHGIGNAVPVIITWYTGQDLENPSCWSQSVWTPTDGSFVAALTLEGWTTRPKCFKFLELCNGPNKCVFVRVVDTCAGCAKGSKHVDLTQAAFVQLADDLGLGILTVQMRPASDPSTAWHEDLWGPKV